MIFLFPRWDMLVPWRVYNIKVARFAAQPVLRASFFLWGLLQRWLAACCYDYWGRQLTSIRGVIGTWAWWCVLYIIIFTVYIYIIRSWYIQSSLQWVYGIQSICSSRFTVLLWPSTWPKKQLMRMRKTTKALNGGAATNVQAWAPTSTTIRPSQWLWFNCTEILDAKNMLPSDHTRLCQNLGPSMGTCHS